MTLLARLRSSSRGILVWMLLAAYVGTPLAAWAQPRPRDVVVPFCTAQSPANSGTKAPRRIVLRFSGHAQVAAGVVQLGLPAARSASFGGARGADFVAIAGRAPRFAPPLAWRPPPRAPPAAPART